MPEITFLGTGGAFTDFRVNYHNNAIVKTDDGYVLIDCGATAPQSLKELGIKPWEVAGIIVTHMHGDHVAGIEQLLWERFYLGPNGPGFLKTPIFASYGVHAALRRTLHDCVDEHTTSTGDQMGGGYDALVDVCYLLGEGSGMACGGVGFNLKPTPHVVGTDLNKPCYGVRVHDMGSGPNSGFYFTSDTTFRANIGELIEDPRIFHDCTFTPYYPQTVHTHYSELLTLPDEVRARIVLMHYTVVPEGVDVLADGFAGAACKHETFVL